MRIGYTVVTMAAVAACFGAAVAARAQQKAAALPSMVVYKSPTCGCCTIWVEHVRAAGFQVEVHNVDEEKMQSVSSGGGVPNDLDSCHTAKVGGYTIEGHVPAADIQRLLKEKPAVAGIAVPGMPIGSPGMEMGGRKDPFSTIAFTKDGKKTVFAKH
jgi:hypothetical protein